MWEHDNLEIAESIFWDPKTMAPLYNTKQYHLEERGIKAKELKKGLVRLSSRIKKLPPILILDFPSINTLPFSSALILRQF